MWHVTQVLRGSESWLKCTLSKGSSQDTEYVNNVFDRGNTSAKIHVGASARELLCIPSVSDYCHGLYVSFLSLDSVPIHSTTNIALANTPSDPAKALIDTEHDHHRKPVVFVPGVNVLDPCCGFL